MTELKPYFDYAYFDPAYFSENITYFDNVYFNPDYFAADIAYFDAIRFDPAYFATRNFMTITTADSGTGTDSNVKPGPSIPDSGTGIETTPALSASLLITDSWSGLEAPTVGQSVNDQGAGADVLSLVVAVVDGGSGAEIFSKQFQVFEVVVGAEGAPSIGSSLIDLGSGSDAPAVTLPFAAVVADTGVGNERFAIRVLRSGRLQYTVRLRVTENVFDASAYDPYSYE